MKKQFDERNLTMVMDFYELTMANGYFKDEDKERKVAFFMIGFSRWFDSNA